MEFAGEGGYRGWGGRGVGGVGKREGREGRLETGGEGFRDALVGCEGGGAADQTDYAGGWVRGGAELVEDVRA